MDARFDRVFPPSEVKRVLTDAVVLLNKLGIPPATLPVSHRLRRIYEAADADLRLHAGDSEWANLADTVELQHSVRILEHARSRHWFDAKALRSSSNYRHDLTLMAAATYLAEAGNEVKPHTSKTAGPRPDMWIFVDAVAGPIEHKAPERLDEPGQLTSADADRVVAGAFESARHQIARASFALLSVGGFRVAGAQLDEARAAGERFFQHDQPDVRHVPAMLVFTVGVARADLPGGLPGTYADRHPNAGVYSRFAVEIDATRFMGILACRVARNPYYSGPVTIRKAGECAEGFYLPLR